ncbi:MAG: substrate-binding domain-containing protein [Oscillospiraceae bacterium]
MIEKRELRAMIIVFFIIAVLAALMAFQLYNAKSEEVVYRISVILNSTQDDYWKQFKKGVDKAALDFNVDVHFLTPTSNENPVQQQIGLVKREIEAGVNAIILFPADSVRVGAWLDTENIVCPIISVGNRLETQKTIRHISADNELMGEKLADAVAGGNFSDVAVLKNFESKSYLHERFIGFEKRMQLLDRKFSICSDTGEIYGFANRDDELEKSYALVAMDAAGSMEISKVLESNNRTHISLFGMDNTSQLLNQIEKGVVDSIVVQSDFDIGYIAVADAVNTLRGEKIENVEIDSYVVNRKNMFVEPYARILVPVS